jgi:nucleoside phosphorylase
MYRVKLLWKVLTELSPDGLAALDAKEGQLFNQRGGRSFIRSIGGNIRTTYFPVVLDPTDIFHDALRCTRAQLNMAGRTFPYEFTLLNPAVKTRINVSLRLYGKVVCATFSLDEFEAGPDTDFIALQKVETHPNLNNFVWRVIAILVSGNKKSERLKTQPKIYPAIHITALEADRPTWKEDMVDLVTHHPNSTKIFNLVLKNNKSHQVDETLILVNKVGVVAYVPSTSLSSQHSSNLQRFVNAASMLEFAAVLRKQLTARRALPEDVVKIITSPEYAIPDSVSATKTWTLFTSTFFLQAELKNIVSKPSRCEMTRVLLVTVTTVETTAIINAFKHATGASKLLVKTDNGFCYYDLGRLGDRHVFLTMSGMGSGGLGGSQETIRRSIDAINPKAVLMAGIAFGIDRSKQAVGEILVANKVLCYELQRINHDASVTVRGDNVPTSPMLLNWVQIAETNCEEQSRFSVTTGLILSGEKLIDNLDFKDKLINIASDAIGGEMEGAGLYVACQTKKIDWILIKAICDWADGKKGRNKEKNQAKAAENVAKYVAHLLESTSEASDLP